jgi:L-aminopeptidase/D-esterase-like protein
VSDPLPPPDGFAFGHWTDPEARTGCTVVLVPPGSRGGVDVRGGGTGTRELEGLSPLANAEGPSAVLLTGGSAYGLAAADGVMRWLEARGIGRPTPGGVVPLVPTAVVFDLVAGSAGSAGVRPGADQGFEACERATAGVPERGQVGAGTGAAVGKLFGRSRAAPGGVGYAAAKLHSGESVAVLAVVNAFGDIVDEDGALLGAPRDEQGALVRTSHAIHQLREPPYVALRGAANTTLVCVCTDAALDKRGCGILARIAGAGIARAVDPAFTPVDGDVVFCIASGSEQPPAPGPAASWALTVIGSLAGSLTAAAIRDAVLTAGRPGAPVEHSSR